MKWLNLALIRLFEFITLMLYSFFVLTYFGAFLLLPLDLLSLLINGMDFIGLPELVSVPGGGAVTGYLCYLVYRMPGLYQIILNGGLELTNAGYAQLGRLETIAAEIAGASSQDTPASPA